MNVNAIAPEHSLGFSPQGLTVIYGGNGSGKSGYSRVLKRACRARDQTETIYPNANHPLPADANARATFSISVNGTSSDVLWTDNQPAPAEISNLQYLILVAQMHTSSTKPITPMLPMGWMFLNDSPHRSNS